MSCGSSRGHTDYVCRKEVGTGQSSANDFGATDECRHEVNVIDSDRASEVQVHSDKVQYGPIEEMSEEKFRVFF